MNRRTRSENELACNLVLLVLVFFTLTSCSSNPSIREKERARYESLENDLISAQAAEQRRKRSEFRVEKNTEKIKTEQNIAPIIEHTAIDKIASDNISATDSIPSPSHTPPLSSSIAAESPKAVTPFPSGATDHIWSLQKYPNPVDGSPLCAVVSTPIVVQNGTLDTKVTIIASLDAVFLRTDAIFDTGVHETGFRIDAGFPIAFDHFINELTAVVDDNFQRLIDAVQTGTTLSVAFAYTPQLSSAESYVIELELESFHQPWSGIAEC